MTCLRFYYQILIPQNSNRLNKFFNDHCFTPYCLPLLKDNQNQITCCNILKLETAFESKSME